MYVGRYVCYGAALNCAVLFLRVVTLGGDCYGSTGCTVLRTGQGGLTLVYGFGAGSLLVFILCTDELETFPDY